MHGSIVVTPDDCCVLSKALSLMVEALGLLDAAGVRADIGAQLDDAISRLQEILNATTQDD